MVPVEVSIKGVMCALHKITPSHPVVVVPGRRCQRDDGVGGRLRNVLGKIVLCHRADTARPYDIPGNTRASRRVSERGACDRICWVPQRDTGTGEVAIAFSGGRHNGLDRACLLSILEALVRAERKNLVLNYRTATRGSILVWPLGRSHGLEKASGVQLVVAEEFPG